MTGLKSRLAGIMHVQMAHMLPELETSEIILIPFNS